MPKCYTLVLEIESETDPATWNWKDVIVIDEQVRLISSQRCHAGVEG